MSVDGILISLAPAAGELGHLLRVAIDAEQVEHARVREHAEQEQHDVRAQQEMPRGLARRSCRRRCRGESGVLRHRGSEYRARRIAAFAAVPIWLLISGR